MQRRDFLKLGGSLVVTFSVPALPSSAMAQTAVGTKDMRPNQVDAWLAIDKDGLVTVYSGKVDLGTGARTALAQMVAEELDVDFGKVHLIMGDTLLTPDQGVTSGSLTLSNGGVTLRKAAASARHALVAEAAKKWSVDPAQLAVSKGVITANGGRRISYGELVDGKALDVAMDQKVKLKESAAHTVVGKSIARVDIPAKVTGQFTYMHDFKLKDMLHARVVRPPYLGATLDSVDESSVAGISGVKVVRKQDFVAVVAKSEWAAVKAAAALKTKWTDHGNRYPEEAKLYEYWRTLPVVKDEPVVQTGDAPTALAKASKRIKATYDFAAHTHGSIGPSCAVADFRDGRCMIWSPSQSTHSLQLEISSILGLPKENVRLIYLDGAGCYGRNGHEDCSADAAIVSQLAGAPVRVQWMRADEHGWDPKSPPTLVDLEAGLDDKNMPLAWRSEFFLANSHGAMTDFPLLAAVLTGHKRTAYYTGNIVKNSDVQYTFPNIKTEVHRLNDTAFRTSHLRTPGRMQNNFANEAFFDELAAAAGADPLQWRMKYLQDPRSLAVLEDVAKMAKWQTRPSPARTAAGKEDIATGRGIAFVRYNNDSTYVALVAQVEVNRKDGDIRVTDIWCSHDCGQVINPDGTINQIEGGLVQTVSRTLMETIHFDRKRVTSVDWNSYPILRFPDVPNIRVSLIDRPEKAVWGAGEMAPTVVPAAISNAVFDAVGVRLRSVPFLPEKVLAGLKTAQA